MTRLEMIKWTATAVLVPAGYLIQADRENALGPILLYLGGLLWLVASVVMRDRALIVTNTVMALAGTVGLLQRLTAV